ncbi:MAG: alpha-mannosidase [Pseudonocardia sp.]|nr:alpha-mannosidase [Pseudonocardia sp.]
MYLEFHRGTYTSQAATKRGNRRCEHLLREAELWAATATVRTGAPYPSDVLDRCWRTVLLQQFHDILPGTSIAWVHQEAERRYAEVAAALEEVIARSLITLTGPGDRPITANAGPYPRAGVPALSAARIQDLDTVSSASRHGGSTTLDDGRVRAVVDQRGLLVSVVVAGRELIPPGSAANLLQLHRDTPTRWDAWDVDEHHRRTVRDLAEVESLTVDGAAVRIVRTFGASTVTQTITLHDGAVDIVTDVEWHERQKLLKLAFPLDVHADRAASEIQFGHVYRPTHTNTSWDAARFETCAHRWVHVGEPGFGVAVANDATYGHDIGRTTRADGGTTTTVRLSLVRAPLFPDPSADQGSHRFVVSLRPDATIADAVAEGYRLNLPLRMVQGARDVEPLISVDDPAVVVEAVKLAEDGSRDVVVRLYEALGSRAVAKVTANFPHRDVTETDLHERAVPASAYVGGTVTLRPFRIVTLRFVI